jgi:TIR domain-containing protein
VARRLSADLRRAGLDPWLDSERLRPGERWKSAIRNAIKRSRYFIALLSSRSVDRKGFVHKEVLEALDELEMQPDSHIYLVPVRLDPCQPVVTENPVRVDTVELPRCDG